MPAPPVVPPANPTREGPRHEPGQGADRRAVGPGKQGADDLAAQDGELVAEHEDLGVLAGGVNVMNANELDEATDQAVGGAEHHTQAGSPSPSCLVNVRIQY